jgi:FMN phosphatase YigB (HAD superfamily)
MPIRGVLFDVGGVLVRTEDPAPRLRWAEKLHLAPASLADIVFENPVARQATMG